MTILQTIVKIENIADFYANLNPSVDSDVKLREEKFTEFASLIAALDADHGINRSNNDRVKSAINKLNYFRR